MNNKIALLYIPIVAMLFASIYYGYSDAKDLRERQNTPPVIVEFEKTEAESEPTEEESEVAETETEVETTAEPTETETETEPVPEPTTEAVTEEPFPLYTVDGDFLDEDLQRFLWEELKIEGIEWWMPYAMLTAYQESGFDAKDVTNGVDMGLYNFRYAHWADRAARFGYPGADIFNPYVQTVVYVKMTAARIKNGFSVNEVISKHKQSDWGPYDQEYVNQVMGHDIVRIR